MVRAHVWFFFSRAVISAVLGVIHPNLGRKNLPYFFLKPVARAAAIVSLLAPTMCILSQMGNTY
jgi:hypothetical protein